MTNISVYIKPNIELVPYVLENLLCNSPIGGGLEDTEEDDLNF